MPAMLHRRRHAGATPPAGKVAFLGELSHDARPAGIVAPILYIPVGITIPSTEGKARKAGVLEESLIVKFIT